MKEAQLTMGFGHAEYVEVGRRIDVSSPDGIAAINRLATVAFFLDPNLTALRDLFGTDEASWDIAYEAVAHHTFPPHDRCTKEQYETLLEAASKKEEIARKLIIEAIEHHDATFGLAPWEREILLSSCRVARHYDELFRTWLRDVKDNPANTKAVELGLTNPYTVIVGDESSGYVQIPYAKRYHNEIDPIATEWERLAQKLSEDPGPESKAFAAYLRAYCRAMRSAQPDELARLWEEVDRQWMAVRGRVQPIGFVEYDYYDPNSIRVAPDFRLAILWGGLAEESEATRRAMLTHLEARYGNRAIWQETKGSAGAVQLFPGTIDAVFAGSLDFQPAGQSLPNNHAVRKDLGVKNFLNPEVVSTRWDQAKTIAKEIFPDQMDLFNLVDPDVDGLAVMITGHEVGEPLFETAELAEALGNDIAAGLNEDVATLAISAIMPMRVASGEFEEPMLVRHAMYLLGTYLRYFHMARGAAHLRNYYRGMGLLGFGRMLEAGFVRRESDGRWRIDPSRVTDVYELSLRDLDTHVTIADEKDKRRAQTYGGQADRIEARDDVQHLLVVISRLSH